MRRWGHIAVCLGYGRQHKTVFISGGADGDTTHDDMWLLDPQSGRMEKVIEPDTQIPLCFNYNNNSYSYAYSNAPNTLAQTFM